MILSMRNFFSSSFSRILPRSRDCRLDVASSTQLKVTNCVPDSWIIVANGPPLPDDLLIEQLKGRKIVVLDGAIDRFQRLNVYPDYLLGDFDSIKNPTYWGVSTLFSEINELDSAYKGNFDITIIPAKNQEYTDLEKGMMFCIKNNATSLFITQATDGRLDHTLRNIGLLKKYHQPDRKLVILTATEQLFYLHNSKITVKGGTGKGCAVMGYPQAQMTTLGLAYNGDQYPLRLGDQESVSNRIVDSEANISIEGEALIILPTCCTFETKKM